MSILKRRDCVERVEEKVRVDLHPERVELRLFEARFHLRRSQLQLRGSGLAFPLAAIVIGDDADHRPRSDSDVNSIFTPIASSIDDWRNQIELERQKTDKRRRLDIA